MRGIHEEVKNNMVTDFKETDLFKVYQTGELANLDITDDKLAKKIQSCYLCGQPCIVTSSETL